ncbi:TPA: nucleotidyltransferase [Patescibacteria group bacterium]|nr:nucleotidyltransferase [Patescibacteria group bacterium]
MNSKISVCVLAAGMGSRYGGLKQMEGFGPSGETIIDYSIYDAIKAGFDRIVFVIRPDMEEAFREIFLSKYEGKIDIDYCFQTVGMVPDWYQLDPERIKPWGTGHALLVSKEKMDTPFIVINGDDFYGRESFEIAAKFLREECDEHTYAMPTYRLKNVLSESGSVKRGVCTVKNGYLEEIEETFDVKMDKDGIINGTTWDGKPMINMDKNTPISQNMFMCHDTATEKFEKRFEDFLRTNKDGLKGEFLLPIVFTDMIKNGEIKMRAIDTSAQWFGVTYKEDAPTVRAKLQELVDQGVYPKKLEV